MEESFEHTRSRVSTGDHLNIAIPQSLRGAKQTSCRFLPNELRLQGVYSANVEKKGSWKEFWRIRVLFVKSIRLANLMMDVIMIISSQIYMRRIRYASMIQDKAENYESLTNTKRWDCKPEWSKGHSLDGSVVESTPLRALLRKTLARHVREIQICSLGYRVRPIEVPNWVNKDYIYHLTASRPF